MKHLLFVCIIIIGLSLMIVGCKKSDSAIGLFEESFHTSSITVYSDGYYGRNMDQPLEIEDTSIINQIIEIASNVDKYSVVQGDELLEGLNGLWIDFNNGTVISMYEDVDYGNVGSEKTITGSPYYHLPKGLRSLIIDILKEKKVIEVEDEIGSGIKYDHEYIFDEVKSIGMKQLMNYDIDAIIEMNIKDIEIAIEKIAGKDLVIAKEPDIAEGALKMNDQQLNITVGCYVDEVYHHARVTGVFKDEVKWYGLDLWTELEPLSQIINRRLNSIVNNEKSMFSSNPYDYTKGNSDYEYIIGLGTDALDVMLEQLKESEDNGLREYILAIACSELLDENIADKNWSTGKEWYELYLESDTEGDVLIEDLSVVSEKGMWDQEVEDQSNFILILSNQSFENSRVNLTIYLDGIKLISQDCETENQHKGYYYYYNLLGTHDLKVISDDGIELAKTMTGYENIPSWILMSYWGKGESARIDINIMDSPFLWK